MESVCYVRGGLAMGWKYMGDAKLVQFPVPGTAELVTLEKGGKAIELDYLVGDLPAGVKATEVKKSAPKAP